MELRSIGGPFTTSSLYFTSPKVPFPALLRQGRALGQTPALLINGKKLFPPKPFLHLKGRALRERNESNWESWVSPTAAAGKTFPHFPHFLCATSWVYNPQEGDDNLTLPSAGSCVSSHDALVAPSITAPKPQQQTRGFQFNHQHRGKWGKSLLANPKEIPLSSHLSPLTGGNKSRKGRFTRRKTSPPYWIFFPPSPNNASYS